MSVIAFPHSKGRSRSTSRYRGLEQMAKVTRMRHFCVCRGIVLEPSMTVFTVSSRAGRSGDAGSLTCMCLAT